MTKVAPPSLKVELVPIDQIQPHPENKRIGDLDTIKIGLQTYDQYAPLVVQKSTGYVLVGNHRLVAARELGWTHINVTHKDVDDDEAEKLLLFDNRASDKGAYDEQGLLDLLRRMDDLSGTGYSPDDLTELERITGELAAQNTSFLNNELNATANGGEIQRPGREFFQLNYPVTAEQREIVLRGLKAAKEQFGSETTIEALVTLCEKFADGTLETS